MTRLSVSFGPAGRSGGGGAGIPISSCSKRSLASVGNYRMLRELGKGNFATVYEAFHTVLKIKVAIKVIDTANVTQPYVLKNLTREAKLLAKLQHPSIVCLYETIRCRSSYYLVTELATGGDLYTHIKSQPGGHLDEETAKSYARQLVSALDHIHREGIVHRDLKMENIMLRDSRKKHIKIIDFGLSNWYNGKHPQTHCGSPEYAAPELFHEGRKYGPEVDLWSLGIILYGMMVGQLPFMSRRNAQTSAEEWREKLMTQIFRGLTTQQEKKIAAMSSDYKDLVKRLLQLQPQRRIPMWQICRHPWINSTDKNIANTVHPSDEAEIKAISEELCDVTKLDPTTVEKELRDMRCGDMTGMFNIIRHRTRGNGSADVFKQSPMSSRRIEIGRFLRQEPTSPATGGSNSSANRQAVMVDKSRSNDIGQTLETADTGAIDFSKELKKLSLTDNPLRSTCPMRYLNSLQAWSRQKEQRSEKSNRRSDIDRLTVKSANSGCAVPVRPMTQPQLLRSTLASRVSSSLSKTSNDSRSRPSCPGPSLLTRDIFYAEVERSIDNKNGLQRQQRHSAPSASQFCRTGSIPLRPEVGKKLQHCGSGAIAHRDRLADGRRLLRNETSVKASAKRYEHQRKRPQSLEITSEFLQRAKTFSRPSASMDRRLI